jgi:hypothetical protein
VIPNLGGLPVFISQQLPMRSTKPGPMKLSPFVTVSGEFRAAMDAWLRGFFGEAEYPQPVLVEALRGYGMVFVSPSMYAEMRRVIPSESLHSKEKT